MVRCRRVFRRTVADEIIDTWRGSDAEDYLVDARVLWAVSRVTRNVVEELDVVGLWREDAGYEGGDCRVRWTSLHGCYGYQNEEKSNMLVTSRM